MLLSIRLASQVSEGSSRVKELIEQLLGLLRDDDENIVRHAVETLREHRCEEVSKALGESLDYVPKSTLTEVIQALLEQEPWNTDKGRRRLLEFLLSHKRLAVRSTASVVLRDELRKSDSSVLAECLRKEESPELLVELLDAVGHGYELLSPSLEELLHHMDKRVRSKAVDGLSKLGKELPSDQLEVLMSDPSNKVRASAVKLRWMRERQSMKDLVLADLGGVDLKRQRCAIYLLGQLKPFDEAAYLPCQWLLHSSIHV